MSTARTIVKIISKNGTKYAIEKQGNVCVVVDTKRPLNPMGARKGLEVDMEVFNSQEEAEKFINSL